jgi:hypothetical protein
MHVTVFVFLWIASGRVEWQRSKSERTCGYRM